MLKPETRRFALFLSLGATILISVGAITITETTWFDDSLTVGRFRQLTANDWRTESRYQLSLIAWKAFTERPLLGWGLENFYYAFDKYYRPGLYNANEVYFDRSHNWILEWLVTGGMVGLVIFIILIVSVLTTLWRKENEELDQNAKALLTGFFAAYLINNLFTFDTITTLVLFFTMLALIDKTVEAPTTIARPLNRRALGVSAMVIVLMTIGYSNAKIFAAAADLAKGIKLAQADQADSQKFLTKALELAPQSGETRAQIAAAAITAITVNPDFRWPKDLANLAETTVSEALDDGPPDSQEFYLLGLLRQSNDDTIGAISEMEKARKLSPNRQLILLRLIEFHLKEKRYREASVLAKETFQLDETIGDTRAAYAATAIYLKNNLLAENLLIAGFGTTTVDNNLLLQAYIDTGQIPLAIRILRQRFDKDRADSDAAKALAAGYVMIGKKEDAITVIRQAMEYNNDFTAAGQKLIEYIRQDNRAIIN